MRKIISFSLWGNNPIYNHGFIQNFSAAKKFYAGWEVVLYYDNTIDSFVKDFITHKKITSFDMSDSLIPGEFWRFLANDLDDVEFTIFRDCDSRLSLREKLAVDEWVDSGKSLHVMRDHPFHQIPLGVNEMGMLAGMWGLKGGKINIKERLDNFVSSNNLIWGSDQTFIFNIYKEFGDDKITHDEFFGGLNFPIERENRHFIGERIDENNNPIGDDYKYV